MLAESQLSLMEGIRTPVIHSDLERRVKLSQWFTDAQTAEQIALFARLQGVKSILEPSCGDGALLNAILQHCDADCRVEGIEIDELLATQTASRFEGRVKVYSEDFLALQPPKQRFELAVMNPPFEHGKTELHILQALEWAERVVCHGPLGTLEGVDRLEELWGSASLTRLAVCSRRRRYSGTNLNGKRPTCTMEIIPGAGLSIVEFWP